MKNSPVPPIWSLLLAGLFAGLISATAQVNEYWDPGTLLASPGSGGTGTWNAANVNWWLSGGSDTTWTSGNIANFAGTNGTVTLGDAEAVDGLIFSTSNYTIGGSGTLTLSGTPTISLSSGTNTMSCALASTVPVTVSGPGILVLSHSGGNTGLTGGVTISPGATVGMNNISGLGSSGGINDSGTLVVTVAATLFANPITGSGVLDINIPYATGSENIRYNSNALPGFSGTINLLAGLSSGSPGAGQIIMTNTAGPSITWNVGWGATLLLSEPAVPFTANEVILNGPGNSQPYGALRLDATTLTANILLNGTNITIGDDSGVSAINGVISDGGNHYGFISTVANGKTLILQGASTYTGPTILGGNGEAGTVELGAPEMPGTSGPLGASPSQNPNSVVFAGGTMEYSSSNSNDYSGRFSTNAGQACNINLNGQSVTFASPLVSSGGTLTLSDSAGGGTLTLGASNTCSGVTTINSGTLNISGSVAGTVINANNGTLQLDNPTALPAGTILTLPASPASGMVNLNFSGTQNITTLNFGATTMPSGTYGSSTNLSVQFQNAAFVGNGVLNVEPPTFWDPGFSEASPGSGGSGSWDSSSTNWFIGSSDTKWVSNNVANFSGNAGTVTLNANETADGLTFNTSGYAVNGASTLTLAGTPVIIVPGGTAEIDCTLAGTAGLTESGSGTLTLGGANTFGGAATIGDGAALVLNAPNAYTGATMIGNGSMLTIAGAGNIGGGTYPGAVANSGSFIYNSSANQNLSGIMSGSGTLTQSGPGNLSSSGLDTFTGSITVNSGTLTISGAGDLGNNPTFNTGAYAGIITDNGAFVYSSSAQQTISGQITGTGSLTQNGPGVLTLAGLDTYTGSTTIATGSQLLFSGVGNLNSGDYETNITNNGTFTFDSSFPQTLGGTISGTGTLTMNASGGSLTLNGANTYTGNTTVSAGTLALGASGSISNSATISLAAGTLFDVSALSNPFALSTGNSLSATGAAGAAAEINGPSAGLNFGSRPLSLTFVPQTFTGDFSDPALDIIQGSLTLNGNAVKVRNSGASPLGTGTYALIYMSSGTVTGNATLSGSVTGAGLAPGTSASLSVSNNVLNLVVAQLPVINNVAVSGGNVVLSGTNGPSGGTYVVLTTTNVTLPFSSWTPIATNTFSGTGTFNVTNAISGPSGFFSIQVTAP